MKRVVVVVVEDDPVNAALFQTLLERRCGCRAILTEDPVEVLRLAREGAGLVVLDVSLRHSVHEGRALNGVELCRLLKQDAATASVPVVLATAHAMRGDDERLLAESGAEDYVSKPIVDHQAFVDQIDRWLRREAA